MSLARTAMPFLVDVQSVLRQHTQLAVLDDDGVLVLARLSSQGAVVNQADVAGRLPPFTTALGLVLLTHAP
ncbi:IclR family transcriptional regulator domain-containing protein, partial [Salmonella enterica]